MGHQTSSSKIFAGRPHLGPSQHLEGPLPMFSFFFPDYKFVFLYKTPLEKTPSWKLQSEEYDFCISASMVLRMVRMKIKTIFSVVACGVWAVYCCEKEKSRPRKKNPQAMSSVAHVDHIILIEPAGTKACSPTWDKLVSSFEGADVKYINWYVMFVRYTFEQ